jgi:hypothetical protein
MNPRAVWIPCRGPLADYWISGYIITPMSPVTGLLLAALGAAFSSAPPPASAVVERVVAVIRPPASAEARVVTLTRVEDEVRIALVSSGAALAATQPLDAPALRAGLEWLVDQMLLSEEAARLQVFEIERREVLAELARFEARFERTGDYRAFLARHDISEEELASVLQRTLRVRRYVESRLTRPSPSSARTNAVLGESELPVELRSTSPRGSERRSPQPPHRNQLNTSEAGRVSEADLTSWIEAHRLELPADRGAARAAARARLLDERFREEVKVLVRDLRARSDVRRVYDFGAAEAGAAARRDPEG